MIKKICVAGAGTMGSGIALAAAQNDFETVLFDISERGIETAKRSVENNLLFLLNKQKITADEKDSINKKIMFSSSIKDCTADIIIEAIVEDLSAKESLYKELEKVNTASAIFASNTSSLSISVIQQNIDHPERIAGMHFFNPAQVMKLVEVVAGDQTSDETIQAVADLCIQLKKTPVICKDAPGFIVNRVARHYYLEAMHLVKEQGLTIEDADALLENAGFKMGPFKLMDLIGMDINLAVSKSIYHAFNENPRFRPSSLQEEKVAAGELGKKTGKGFYNYSKENPQ